MNVKFSMQTVVNMLALYVCDYLLASNAVYHVHSKRRYIPTGLQGVSSQKTVFFVVTVV